MQSIPLGGRGCETTKQKLQFTESKTKNKKLN